MAESVVAKLPFTSFPGLAGTSNPITEACHGAWNELVVAVGPDFTSQASGEGAERLAADPARVPQG
eukprot:11695036-Alexandrium_andersonii.AAC.1